MYYNNSFVSRSNGIGFGVEDVNFYFSKTADNENAVEMCGPHIKGLSVKVNPRLANLDLLSFARTFISENLEYSHAYLKDLEEFRIEQENSSGISEFEGKGLNAEITLKKEAEDEDSYSRTLSLKAGDFKFRISSSLDRYEDTFDFSLSVKFEGIEGLSEHYPSLYVEDAEKRGFSLGLPHTYIETHSIKETEGFIRFAKALNIDDNIIKWLIFEDK